MSCEHELANTFIRWGNSKVIFHLGDVLRPVYWVKKSKLAASSVTWDKYINDAPVDDDLFVHYSNIQMQVTGVYLNWLNSTDLNQAFKAIGIDLKVYNEILPLPTCQLLQLYNILIECILTADTIINYEFKNAAMDVIIRIGRQTHQWPIDTQYTKRAGDALYDCSTLYHFLIDMWVYAGTASWTGNPRRVNMREYPRDFWYLVILRILATRDETDTEHSPPWDVNPCEYHAHMKEDEEWEG